MKFFIVIVVMLLTACQNTVSDYSFMSLKGVAVEKPTPVKKPVCVKTPPLHEQSEEDAEGMDACEAVEDRVYFDTNRYDVGPLEQDVCDRYAVHYNKTGGRRVVVDGHCDERGSRDYNLGLGMRRAAAVKDALTGSGVPGGMIAVRSFGKDRPIVWGSTPEAWAKNRVAIIRAV